MIRHPSELFLKFLLTSENPQAREDSWILYYVEQLGFPRPDPMYLTWLRSAITPKIPQDFQPRNRYHRESVRFLKEENIYSLHNPDSATQDCLKILTNLRARPIIEDLLLGRVDPKDVAKKVNARLQEFFTADVIESYAHYFWNVSLLTVDDWAVMLKAVDYRREHTLAILQVGPAMALHKHGFQQQIDSKTVLREIQETLYFDFRDWKAQPRSIARTKALTVIARTAVSIDERLSEADSALKESLAAFERFRMRQNENGVKGLHELAPGGNYSASGSKLLEAEEVPK